MKSRADRGFQLPGVVVLLVGLAALVASTAALTPHDDGEGKSCLVCKAGNQPLLVADSSGGFLPPSPPVAYVAPLRESTELSDTACHRSPRAPPV